MSMHIYLDDVTADELVQVGCVACIVMGFHGSPSEIHHMRDGVGIAQRSPDSRALPLCAAHHRTGGHGIAFHAGKQAFEQNYGTELNLLALAHQEVMKIRQNTV